MFNLVKYRAWFVIASLVIIVPGVISLLIFGMNAGTDFLGGTSVQLRPQTKLTSDQVTNLLKPLNLKDLQVTIGDNKQISANKTVWVKFDRLLDDTVQQAIIPAVQKKYSHETSLKSDFKNITPASGSPFTLVTLSGFQNTPQVDDVRSALSNLPKTTGVAGKNSSATTTAATTPTAAATVAVTPTTTASAKATPAATAASSSSSVATYPVKVSDVQSGASTQTIDIITRTGISSAVAASKDDTDLASVQAAFLKGGGPYFQVLNNSQIGAAIASATQTYSVLAVAAASVLIVLYVWFAFRKVPKAYRYGACAILALLHDVLVVVGIFSILGHFFNVQIDSLFITALLTVVGFSVHDTIVVFDRIRENMQRRTSESFEDIVNASLVQTLARSLNTSLTVLFTLLALTLFTGTSASVHTFTLALLIGIFSGTYSSIFNASMLLVMWEKGETVFGIGRHKQPQQSNRNEREVRELARSRG